jgi:hypothetical protein
MDIINIINLLEKNIDNETYDVKSCFVMHVGSNAKDSRIKPYT